MATIRNRTEEIYEYFLDRAIEQGDVIEDALVYVDYDKDINIKRVVAFFGINATHDPRELANNIAAILEAEHKIKIGVDEEQFKADLYPIEDHFLDMQIEKCVLH